MENNKQQELWTQILQFYKDKFNLEPDMVDLATNFDILKMCATGASNKTIADFLNIDEELVTNTIDKYLGFTGWEEDLKYNPYKIYTGIAEEFSEFEFTLVNAVLVLERMLDEKWV